MAFCGLELMAMLFVNQICITTDYLSGMLKPRNAFHDQQLAVIYCVDMILNKCIDEDV